MISQGNRIVVLEGDPNIRQLLCGAALRFGQFGIAAASFAEARAKLRWFEADGVIVDFDLGEWREGMKLVRDLSCARVPLVVHTEHLGPTLRSVGLTAPIVPKRASHEELFVTIVDAIDRHQEAPEQEDRSWP